MYAEEPIPEQDDQQWLEQWYEMKEQQAARQEAWWQMMDQDEDYQKEVDSES